MLFADQAADIMSGSKPETWESRRTSMPGLEERLTGDEFMELSDNAMHELPRQEYTAYSPPSPAI